MYGRTVIGKCPICGADVIEKNKSYGCSNWKETGCSFTIWKESFGHRFTEKEVKLLLAGDETGPVELVSRMTGRPYKASLYYDDSTGRVRFRFPDDGGGAGS